MGILDTENNIRKLDPNGMIQSINDFPDQIVNVWQELQDFVVPSRYYKCNKILILGMGGSAIGGDLAMAIAQSSSRAPILVQRDYDLPNYIDSNTLVIGVSYSGNTEETIDAFNKAAERDAKIIAISCGGKIESVCNKYNAPLFRINYGSQPRAALGDLLTSLIYIFYKLDYIQLGKNEISDTAKQLKIYQKELILENPTSHNTAKQLAQKLQDKIVFIMGAGVMGIVAKRD